MVILWFSTFGSNDWLRNGFDFNFDVPIPVNGCSLVKLKLLLISIPDRGAPQFPDMSIKWWKFLIYPQGNGLFYPASPPLLRQESSSPPSPFLVICQAKMSARVKSQTRQPQKQQLEEQLSKRIDDVKWIHHGAPATVENATSATGLGIFPKS